MCIRDGGGGRALALRSRPEAGRVFVIDSDGECNEGSLWEAALSAAKHRLENLTVLLDYNHMQSLSLIHISEPTRPY